MTQWDSITAAVGVALGGDREAGLAQLTSCWDDTREADHAQRCVIAHYLADLQPDLADEVAWDERALAAYAGVTEAALAPIGIPRARGLAPSLHLNLGDGYLRQGRVDDARAQLEAGLADQGELADDGYGAMIRAGLSRLQDRIIAAETPATSEA
jgi:hypothetical protein